MDAPGGPTQRTEAPDGIGPSPRTPLVLVTLAVAAVAVVLGTLGSAIRAGSAARAAADTPQLAAIDAAGRLAALTAAGSPVAELGGTRTYDFPAWSPDGTRIAAIATGDEPGVHVFRVEPEPHTDPTVVFDDPDHPPFYLSWSPDGEHIAFLTTEPDGIALRVAPADGSSDARIVHEGEPLYWDWSGADRLLVHSGADRPDAFLGEIGLDGVTTEPEPLAPGVFRSPAMASGARHRAWVARGDGAAGQSVVLERLDRTDRHGLDAAGNVALGFDPAGDRLAIISARDPALPTQVLPVGPLRLVDVATGDAETIVDDDALAWSWSPDGSTLAVLTLATGPGDPDEARTPARLASAADLHAAVQPRGIGLRLAFLDAATGEERSSRDVRVSELFAFQVLPYFDQYALSHRWWSADGAWFTLPLAGELADQLVAIQPDDGATVVLGDAVFGSWRP